jgi:hypothetical protein
VSSPHQRTKGEQNGCRPKAICRVSNVLPPPAGGALRVVFDKLCQLMRVSLAPYGQPLAVYLAPLGSFHCRSPSPDPRPFAQTPISHISMKVPSIILAVIVTFSANAEDQKSPTIEASAIYRATVAAAKSIVVFEGLPHQMWDRDLLAVEIQRKDTQKIWEFPFYTPSIAATNADDLRQLLSSSNSIVVYGGPKGCGGYHPDYCISWQAEEITYYALVCFGCHEIVFYDGKKPLIYDLDEEAYERYKKLLAIYEAKRPKRKE